MRHFYIQSGYLSGIETIKKKTVLNMHGIGVGILVIYFFILRCFLVEEVLKALERREKTLIILSIYCKVVVHNFELGLITFILQ